MTGERQVVVTGIGIICPLGIDTQTCWQNMLSGKSGISWITKFDASDCITKIGGQLPEEYYSLEKADIPKRMFKQTIRAARVIFLCAQQAVEDSNVEPDKTNKERVAVIIGSGGSSFQDIDRFQTPDEAKFRIVREMLNALPAWISIEYGFHGPNFTVSTACASGGYAIGMAYKLIKSGQCDLAIAGGVDTMLTKGAINRYNAIMAISEENDPPGKSSRPFDKKRSGFVLSEGGCAIILEELYHAENRSAKIYSKVSGYGANSEAYNIIAPEPTGDQMARTMELAIMDANIPKEKIGYINAHGTSTHHNDLCETIAIKKAFKEHAYQLAVSSQKSMIGHTIGAAGAIEFAITALSLKNQEVTPTINYEYPDPECDLDYVPNSPRKTKNLNAAISNSFGFGGHNCSIILERY